jgi:hypothetical protein
VANSYANLRTQSGMSIQTARTVPHREVWTQSNYYNIPTTNTATVSPNYTGKRKFFNDWYLGLREDGFTYSIDLESDKGNFISNAAVTLGNTYSRNNVSGGQIVAGTYILPDSANTANITLTVTRNDGLVLFNNAVRQINLQLPTAGSLTRGGMFVGSLTDSGNTWGLVVSPSTNSGTVIPYVQEPNIPVPYETANNFKSWITGSEPFPIPTAVNDLYRGDLNTAALKALANNDKFVVVNQAVDLFFGEIPNIIDDYYVPSVEEMRLILQFAGTQNDYYGTGIDYPLITLDKYYWTSTVVNQGGELGLNAIRRTTGGSIETITVLFSEIAVGDPLLGLRVVRRIVA